MSLHTAIKLLIPDFEDIYFYRLIIYRYGSILTLKLGYPQGWMTWMSSELDDLDVLRAG